MMTLEELQNAQINPDVAREAFDQASKRLADILDTRKSSDQKAFTLFSGYLTISLGLFAAGVALLNDKQARHVVVTVWAAGSVFLAAAFLLVMALLDAEYGAMGSDPKMWLTPGVIDGGEAAIPAMLAYLGFQYQERIDRSAQANERKALWTRVGVFLGMLAPLIASPCLLIHEAWLKALF